ncbi:hypothetical protein GWI33_010084, partial [Rhynchophorus ferrugineus]
MNIRSGHHGWRHQTEIQLIAQTLDNAGFDVQMFLAMQDLTLDECIDQAIHRHSSYPHTQRGMIVAAGGDGTINAVVQHLLHTEIELGILPFGTFNYVARALNIPVDVPEAVQNLIDGQTHAIHVGSVNGKIYLNNASIGLYPVIIESREYYNKKFGRFPLVAYLSGLSTLLRPYHPFKLRLKIDGYKHLIDSPLVFFGNNQLQLQDLKLRLASCAAQGKLAGV